MKTKLLFLLLLSNIVVQAQPLQSENKAKAYFAEHIQQLDPIEGVYDVENIVDIYSAYAGWETIKQHFVCAILKGSEENFFFVHSFEGDVKGLIGGIEKLGGSRYYSFDKIDGNGNQEKIQFQLNDLFSFELKGKTTYKTAKSQTTTKFIKKYPTQVMYAEIREKEARSNSWSGTGFALKNGYILTNYHVINEASTINVYGINEDFANGFKATVVGTDKINDLALLKISGNIPEYFNSIPYGFRSTIADVGENVYVLGYPLTTTMGEEVKLTNGIISAKTGFDGDVSQYQISAPIQPGNSGGPLIDYSGNIIGVVCAKHIGTENVSYAVKTSQVKNLIESVANLSIMNTTNVLRGKSLKDQVKSVNKYVFIIKCSH